MEQIIKELEQLIENFGYGKDGYPNEARVCADNFTNDYDWDNEWEAFDPQEAMSDAFIAGIRFVIDKLKEKK